MEQYETEIPLGLTPKQNNLLQEIYRRTQGSEEWCAVAVLSTSKTILKMSTLARNLRQLERLDLIERRLDDRSREYVKLKKAPAKERLCNLYEMND
jgi:DNA-binding MarR family transcriptional regulator